MHSLLAYAEAADTSDTNMVIILIRAGLILGVCVMAFIPIALSRGRRNRQADTIMAATVLWAMIAIGTSIYVCLAQFQWQKEYTTRIESGYGNPTDTDSAPKQPYKVWIVLAAGYVTLLSWSMHKRPAPNDDSSEKIAVG